VIYKYLDLTTAHLPEEEMQQIATAPPRVIPHEYGAWVNVQHDDTDEVDEQFTEDGTFPVLAAIVKYARELDDDINWINFDRDGEPIDGLPTFDW
jgi:hypothetical protein